MSMKERVLRKLAADAGSGTGWLLDKLDRPGRATRAAIGAYQEGSPILEAARAQLGANPPEAPSGADIAERVGQDYDIQSPAALAAIATLADVADPTMFVPGGQATKLGTLAKVAGKGGKAAQGAKKAESFAEGLKRIKDSGKKKLEMKDLSPTAQNVTDEAMKKKFALDSIKKKLDKAQESKGMVRLPKGTDVEQVRRAVDILRKRGDL